MAKLDDEKVLEMRSKHAAGWTYERLCLEYGVSMNSCRNAVKGLSYQHLERETPIVPVSEVEASAARLLASLESMPATTPEVDPLEEMLARRAAKRILGEGCEDEGCPHFGTPHSHTPQSGEETRDDSDSLHLSKESEG